MERTIFTIGHSTRSFEEFAALLREFRLELVVDVRRYPGSRRYPHFGRDHFPRLLDDAGFTYLHLPDLGGRRSTHKDSQNTGWRSDAFRGYADYMGTEDFRRAIDELLAIEKRLTIMCAEAVPWRCHRNLISDELTRRQVDVTHILGAGSSTQHELNPMARDAGTHLVYPAEAEQRSFF